MSIDSRQSRRNLMTLRSILALSALIFLCAGELLSDETDEAGISIERLEPWSTVFAETKIKIPCRLRSTSQFVGRLVWGLSTNENITLSRGELAVTQQENDESDAGFELTFPDVKPGLILPTKLAIHLVADGNKQPVASVESPIWIYPPDPFYDRTEWLKGLQLSVFDPAGKTVELFNTLELSFAEITNISNLEILESGVLIIGEGVSFREERALPAAMLELAARGIPVICLAPDEGDLLIPSPNPAEKISPSSVLLQNAEAIRRLDKRLDAVQWMTETVRPANTISLDRQGSQLLGEVVSAPDGWSWIEIHFANQNKNRETNPRCVVCCFPIIERWDDGPTPRYLLVRLLEYVAPSESSHVASERKGQVSK
ncbi:MAG: hypothetical protein ACKVT0_19635 [Planctomycetaceae bacterium]